MLPESRYNYGEEDHADVDGEKRPTESRGSAECSAPTQTDPLLHNIREECSLCTLSHKHPYKLLGTY